MRSFLRRATLPRGMDESIPRIFIMLESLCWRTADSIKKFWMNLLSHYVRAFHPESQTNFRDSLCIA
jgi:hypothetical protein